MATPTKQRRRNGRANNDESLVPMRRIRKLAREIAEKFQPERIILFGSYAYGKPTQDSDVDMLVVMKARNQIDKACQIIESVEASVSLDLIVRTPASLAWRLRDGDWFLREIMSQGKVLYEKTNARLDSKGRVKISQSR